jgi:hypothetical protein
LTQDIGDGCEFNAKNNIPIASNIWRILLGGGITKEIVQNTIIKYFDIFTDNMYIPIS